MIPSTLQDTLCNREAEEAVLGSVLINPEVLVDLLQIIQTEDFFIQRHRWIWEAILSVADKKSDLDLLTICHELERTGRLGEAGGPAHMTGLFNQSPSSLHAESYARIVADLSLRRKMYHAGEVIIREAFNLKTGTPEMLETANRTLNAVLQQVPASRACTFSTALAEFQEQWVEKAHAPGALQGITTGIDQLDALLSGGLQRSDLVIIAGRPGTGKTSFLLSIARNAAQYGGHRAGIFSLEMDRGQLVQRFLSMETEIPSDKFRSGLLDDGHWRLVQDSIAANKHLGIYLDDSPAITPSQLRARCQRWKAEFGLDLVIVDYLQLMSGDRRIENRVQEVSYISRSLKQMAKELNVPVLAAAQLSRAVEQRQDKKPILSDLRESGSIEMDADIVIFIHRPFTDPDQEPSATELIIAKHRNGPVGVVPVEFTRETTRFS